ncbi:hypothetical protein [Bacillus mycoides]|uniref:hypothetical protein n=1 Tax=Bacillus mycoides TaxID=1405 RepID=UPI002111E9DB|nr:hypothetical protein [Bacillus mycoides]MCQ6527882.1 hypothetical protein [Bacillus mycoides]
MCTLCHDTGIIRKETYPGVTLTEGCNCEVAKQQEADFWGRRKAFTKRLEEWKRGLLHEQRIG